MSKVEQKNLFIQTNIEVYLGGKWKPIPNALLPISVIQQLDNLTTGSLAITDEDSEEIFIRNPITKTD